MEHGYHLMVPSQERSRSQHSSHLMELTHQPKLDSLHSSLVKRIAQVVDQERDMIQMTHQELEAEKEVKLIPMILLEAEEAVNQEAVLCH